MITLLAKIFIKDSFSENKKREMYGSLCGALGIFLNILLSAGKIFAGAISGSVAITADGFNNLSDAGSSIITLIGFKLAGQKPDKKHPYGHGRMEYIAGLFISGIILIMAYQLFRDAIEKIIHPEATEFNYLIAGILIASILVKCYMAFYSTSVGKKIGSATIRAIARDSLNDCIATGVVFASGLIGHFAGIQIDGFAGLVVAAFVLAAGISSMKETIEPLLGQGVEEEFLKKIEDYVMGFAPEIIGIHDLLVHDYGPGRMLMSLHVEVPAEADIMQMHDLIDNVEKGIGNEFSCLATIHMDPVVTKDERVLELKAKVEEIVAQVDEKLSIHDFRVVFGTTHTNMIFDLVIPFEVKEEDGELIETISAEVKRVIGETYFCVIEIDKM